MMLKRRRTKPRRVDPGSVPGHLQFIRGFECAVRHCREKAEAHHVRVGIPATERGGTGKKPHDKWSLPLCATHHHEIHAIGHATFEAKHQINLVDIATDLWRQSPHRYKQERKEAENAPVTPDH